MFKESTKQKGFAPILIILVIAVMAAGAYFLGTKNILELPNSLPLPGLFPSPTPTPDPTANWRTYTNTELNISFKLSSLEEPVVNGGLVENSKSKMGGALVNAGVFYNPNNLGICDPKKGIAQKACLLEGNSQGQEKDIAEYTLGGKKAVSFYVWETEGNSIYRIIQLEDNSFTIATAVDGPGLAEGFENILSTFKFTD